MKRALAVVTAVAVLAASVPLFAQGGGGGGGGGFGGQRGTPRTNFFDKEQLATYLGLNDAQKKTVSTAVDAITKIYQPFFDEYQKLRVSAGYNAPATPPALNVVMLGTGGRGGAGGARAGGGGGGGGGRAGGGGGGGATVDFAKFQTDVTALAKKYEPKEADIKAQLAIIEKALTTDEQKTKWNDAAQLRKPTFVVPQGGGF